MGILRLQAPSLPALVILLLGAFSLVAASAAAQPPAPITAPQTYVCTGAPQTYVVPPGVSEVYADVRGAVGAPAENGAGGLGGAGARVLSRVFVGSATTLTIYVGCPGQGTSGGWGWSFGGDGDSVPGTLSANGGGGGGSSAITAGTTPIVVAGGGGGGGGNNVASSGQLGGPGGNGGEPAQEGAPGQNGKYAGTGPGPWAGGCGGCLSAANGGNARRVAPDPPPVNPVLLAPWGGGGGGGGGVAGGQGGETTMFAGQPGVVWPVGNAGGGGGGLAYSDDVEALFVVSPGAGRITVYPTIPYVASFACSDGATRFSVPPNSNANELIVTATGAAGIGPEGNEAGLRSGAGGLGASVEATLPVGPGDQFDVQAGCQPISGGAGGIGWANGGARGGGIANDGKDGGAGGGASGVASLGGGTALVIAGGGGGGGGAGALNDGADGSDGGTPTARPGEGASDNSGGCAAADCGAGADGEHGHDAADEALEAGGGGGGGGGFNGGGGGHAADRTGGGEGAGGGGGGDSRVSGERVLAKSFGVSPAPGNGTVTLLAVDDTTPVDVSVDSGSGQSAPVSSAFPAPLRALVTDRSGQPVAGVQVSFTIPPIGPGTGSFPDGATSATATSDASGVATAPAVTAGVLAGGWSVSASIPGDPHPASFALRNTVVPTRLRLSSTANPALSGALVNYTALIEVPIGAPPCDSNDSCSVLFLYYENGREIEIGQVVPDSTWTAVSPPIAFTKETPVSAYFAGPGFALSSQAIEQQVLPLSIATSPSPIPYDTPFDLVATTSLATGEVTIHDPGGAVVCTLVLGSPGSGCKGIVRPSSSAGTEVWIAAYTGASAPFPVTFTEQVPSAVTVTTSTSTPYVGTPFVVAAQVVPATGAGPVAAGSVVLTVDGADVGFPVAVDANGRASFPPLTLASAGAHRLAVGYLGQQGRYTSRASDLVDLSATPVPVQIALSSSANPAVPDATVTLTARLTVPEGTPPCAPSECLVAFFGSGTFYGSAQPGADWTVAIQTSWPDVGTYPVTAQFLGSARFAGLPTTMLNQVIDAPGTPGPESPETIAITSSSPPNARRLWPYWFRMTATGSPAPRFHIHSGRLPHGLWLLSNGVILGVPLHAGRFAFTVQASNSAGGRARARYVINVSGGGALLTAN